MPKSRPASKKRVNPPSPHTSTRSGDTQKRTRKKLRWGGREEIDPSQREESDEESVEDSESAGNGQDDMVS